jgi:hypothetical protein
MSRSYGKYFSVARETVHVKFPVVQETFPESPSYTRSMKSFTEISMGNISRMPFIGLKQEQFHKNYKYAYGKHFVKMGNFSANLTQIAWKIQQLRQSVVVKRIVSRDWGRL